jgi:hypothetical protein
LQGASAPVSSVTTAEHMLYRAKMVWQPTAGIGDVPVLEKHPARWRIYFKRWILKFPCGL